MRKCFKCQKKIEIKERYYFLVKKGMTRYKAVSIGKPMYYHEKCLEVKRR